MASRMPIDDNCNGPDLDAYCQFGPALVLGINHMLEDTRVVDARPMGLPSAEPEKELDMPNADAQERAYTPE